MLIQLKSLAALLLTAGSRLSSLVVCFALLSASCSTSDAPQETAEVDDGQATEAAAQDLAAQDEVSGGFQFVSKPIELEKREVEILAIGAPAPDFRLAGVDDRWWSLSDFADSNALVVVFTCNHCPTAQAYEDRLIEIYNDYLDKDVAVVAISPTSPIALLPEECGHSDLDDSFEAMKTRAAEKQFPFPYLYDGDDQTASLQFGPKTTPHAFVFDKEHKLQYAGRIDTKEHPSGGGRGEDLRAAIDSVLAGESPEPATTKTFGCSVKWSWKTDWKKKVEADWKALPVEVQPVDLEGVKELMANNGENLRLVNVWATWCGPCVVEFPELVGMHRSFGTNGKRFEVVAISMDGVDNSERVLRFLNGKAAAFQNVIWSEEDKYAMIEAIDPEWDGALPYSILIEPGGEALYRLQGSIEPYELRKLIVEHELLGRYF